MLHSGLYRNGFHFTNIFNPSHYVSGTIIIIIIGLIIIDLYSAVRLRPNFRGAGMTT